MHPTELGAQANQVLPYVWYVLQRPETYPIDAVSGWLNAPVKKHLQEYTTIVKMETAVYKTVIETLLSDIDVRTAKIDMACEIHCSVGEEFYKAGVQLNLITPHNSKYCYVNAQCNSIAQRCTLSFVQSDNNITVNIVSILPLESESPYENMDGGNTTATTSATIAAVTGTHIPVSKSINYAAAMLHLYMSVGKNAQFIIRKDTNPASYLYYNAATLIERCEVALHLNHQKLLEKEIRDNEHVHVDSVAAMYVPKPF
jgi:hypothetical protein